LFALLLINKSYPYPKTGPLSGRFFIAFDLSDNKNLSLFVNEKINEVPLMSVSYLFFYLVHFKGVNPPIFLPYFVSSIAKVF
jgi:hypothetical protein